MSYNRGSRYSQGLVGSVGRVVLIVVVMSMFFGMPFVIFLAEFLNVASAWLIEIAQRVAE